tara:strand:+ start:258 stop:743 length:486 start_codon:yes stop_codon:yes gene_type:complete
MIPITATAMPLFLLLSMYDTDTVGEAIKLSLAPIFLIGALGHYLTVLVSRKDSLFNGLERLRREIDESQGFDQQRQRLIRIYGSRRRSLTLLMKSIQLVTVVILLTAIDVIVLFISSVTPLNMSGLVLPIFALAMVCLICSSLLFLRELSMASREFQIDFD